MAHWRQSVLMVDVHVHIKAACEVSEDRVVDRILSRVESLLKYDQCDHKAIEQQYLTIHIKSVHKGVKYPYDQCDCKARYQSHVRQHKMSVHMEIRYVCNLCDLKFTTQGSLKRHKISLYVQEDDK